MRHAARRRFAGGCAACALPQHVLFDLGVPSSTGVAAAVTGVLAVKEAGALIQFESVGAGTRERQRLVLRLAGRTTRTVVEVRALEPSSSTSGTMRVNFKA